MSAVLGILIDLPHSNILTDRKEDTMILKIIKYNEQIEEDRLPNTADVLLMEADHFFIQDGNDDVNNLNYTQHTNVWITDDVKVYKTIHDNEVVLFDKAYLMNNDGKTIERYG